MKKVSWIALVCLALFAWPAYGQQFDVAFGVGSLIASSGSSALGNHAPVTMGGGAYPSFSGDYLFNRSLGFGGEVAWRASQNIYPEGQPFRPILYDFDGVWGP